jgi:hypothetical protein
MKELQKNRQRKHTVNVDPILLYFLEKSSIQGYTSVVSRCAGILPQSVKRHCLRLMILNYHNQPVFQMTYNWEIIFSFAVNLGIKINRKDLAPAVTKAIEKKNIRVLCDLVRTFNLDMRKLSLFITKDQKNQIIDILFKDGKHVGLLRALVASLSKKDSRRKILLNKILEYALILCKVDLYIATKKDLRQKISLKEWDELADDIITLSDSPELLSIIIRSVPDESRKEEYTQRAIEKFVQNPISAENSAYLLIPILGKDQVKLGNFLGKYVNLSHRSFYQEAFSKLKSVANQKKYARLCLKEAIKVGNISDVNWYLKFLRRELTIVETNSLIRVILRDNVVNIDTVIKLATSQGRKLTDQELYRYIKSHTPRYSVDDVNYVNIDYFLKGYLDIAKQISNPDLRFKAGKLVMDYAGFQRSVPFREQVAISF